MTRESAASSVPQRSAVRCGAVQCSARFQGALKVHGGLHPSRSGHKLQSSVAFVYSALLQAHVAVMWEELLRSSLLGCCEHSLTRCSAPILDAWVPLPPPIRFLLGLRHSGRHRHCLCHPPQQLLPLLPPSLPPRLATAQHASCHRSPLRGWRPGLCSQVHPRCQHQRGRAQAISGWGHVKPAGQLARWADECAGVGSCFGGQLEREQRCLPLNSLQGLESVCFWQQEALSTCGLNVKFTSPYPP